MNRLLAGNLPKPAHFGTSVHISDISEEQLIQACLPFLPKGDSTLIPSGDDAAVIATDSGFVVTTDVLIENSHFRCDWSTAFDVGWRAAAQNLADVAAMGAWPQSVVVGLALPRSLQADWVVECASGIGAYCAQYNCGVVGGDITVYAGNNPAEQIVISIAAMGNYDPMLLPENDIKNLAITRDGACVGDVIGVIGTVGLSRTGLQILLDNTDATSELNCDDIPARQAKNSVQQTVFQQCLDTYRCPRPPIHELFELLDIGRPHAMMDVSDGLLKDAARMAHASGVTMDFSTEALKVFTKPIKELYPHDTATKFVLTGGEDHSFLVCLSPELAQHWEMHITGIHDSPAVPTGRFHRIGIVRDKGDDVQSRVFVDGGRYLGIQGWDHGANHDELDTAPFLQR